MKLVLVFGAIIPLSLFGQQDDSLTIEVKNIGEAINSTFEDYAPIISADGAIMIITSKRPSTIKEHKEGLENIYFSEFKNSTWQNTRALSFPINQKKRNNSAIALSNDGQHLLLYRDDANGNGDIWESYLKGTEWSKPRKLPAPINSENHESSASISPDGNTFFFVSDRKNGFGKRDIWYCQKEADGNWGAAINLGSNINTTEDEEGVYIHPDGKTLYFSSKGHGANGQFDVFKSIYENDKWSSPISLGTPINTPNNDLFFVMTADGKKAYYATSDAENNQGGKDIYEITFSTFQKENSPSLTLLKGTVSDSITGKFLEAKIIISDNSKNAVISEIMSNSATGNYLSSLPAGKNYNITVHLDGYLFYSTNIAVQDTSGYLEVTKNIRLSKLEIGNKIVLNNIFFEYDQTALREDSYIELNNLYDLMIKNPKLTLEISGHTDNIGNETYNKQLSEDRAKSVVQYLVNKGIDASRLKYVGYGFQFPVATNSTDEGRKRNRRVEFKVLSK